jgi:hypothetical protein
MPSAAAKRPPFFFGGTSEKIPILLVFDATGTLKTNIEYKLYGHANSNLAPAVTIY